MTQYAWGHERRFNAYTNYIKTTFGGRIQKVSLDAGFTCPNRDGNKGKTGCIYCNNDGFSPSYAIPSKTITQQLDEGIAFLSRRYRSKKYIAYFQAYTNTYQSLDHLKQLYQEALSHPKIDGLTIGTRPDCIDIEKVEYLSELSKEYHITVEFGIESCYNQTLEFINRGHTWEDTIKAYELCKDKGFHLGGHMLFGMPGESKDMMLAQARMISKLPLHTVKFHQLQILKSTPLATIYKKQPEIFNLFTYEDYIEFIIDFTELLSPSIIIERFCSESPPYTRIAPFWGDKRIDVILNDIEQRMEERNTWQGKFFLP